MILQSKIILPPFYQSITWRSQHEERENMDTKNTPDKTAPNQTTIIERIEKNKYKMQILADRETDLTKQTRKYGENKSQNTLTSHTEKPRRTDGSMNRFSGCTDNSSKQRRCHLGLGPKAKH